MSYGYLPPELEPVADAARKYMRTQWGVSDNRIAVERPIDSDITPGPTFQGPLADHHIACIEVASSAYPRSLGSVVVRCVARAIPAFFYVALEEASARTDEVRAATQVGVGVLLLGANGIYEFAPAQSLSLFGVRDPEPTTWPPKYRRLIDTAHQTFKTGDPSKGCSILFEQIEGITRRICLKATKRNAWRNLPSGTKVPDAANKKVPLASIAKFMYDYFDAAKAGAPDLDGVFGPVVGAVSNRNVHVHPPKDLKALKRRDTRAKTHFELAADIFRDLVEGAAPLRV